MTETIDVQMVHLRRRLVMFADGLVEPITNLLDDDNDETDVLEDVVDFVAFHPPSGKWVRGAIANYFELRVN